MNGLPNGELSGSSSGGSKGGKKGKGNQPNQRVAMYCVKRPYEVQDITLPKTMYNVEPIQKIQNGTDDADSLPGVSESNHSVASSVSRGTLAEQETVKVSTSTSSMISSASVNDDQVASLEKRQLQIIDKLTRLREVITGIHEKCVLTGTINGNKEVNDIASAASSLTSVAPVPKETELDEIINVVVNANPRQPPWSILYLAKKLEKSYRNAKASVTSHLHSSYKYSIDAKQFEAFRKPVENANFKFHVIWRDVPHSSLLISPIQTTRIAKEPNMARFLSRLLPPSDSLNYDCLNWDRLVAVDHLLEQATYSKNIVEIISQELKRSKKTFLAGELTIADLVLYSIVKSKLAAGLKEKDLPSNVTQWTQKLAQVYKDLLGK